MWRGNESPFSCHAFKHRSYAILSVDLGCGYAMVLLFQALNMPKGKGDKPCSGKSIAKNVLTWWASLRKNISRNGMPIGSKEWGSRQKLVSSLCKKRTNKTRRKEMKWLCLLRVKNTSRNLWKRHAKRCGIWLTRHVHAHQRMKSGTTCQQSRNWKAYCGLRDAGSKTVSRATPDTRRLACFSQG